MTSIASAATPIAASATPKARAATGGTRPLATGRALVRSMSASMSRSYQWLIALEPPETSAMASTVHTTSSVPGQPSAASASEPIVVMTISSMMRGLSSCQ